MSANTFEADEAQRLKIVIVGHVDHGKSTLIGRLFYDTNSLPDGKVESIRKACEAEGMEFEYAFLLDALLEEQEQNITIDTTQIQFRTPSRNYVIIDAPGHKEFLKNMITGAASADAAILLIDAKEGVQEQSRRHGYLLSLLGIKQVIVAVNKMDLVNFDKTIYEEICTGYTAFLEPLGVKPSHFIPVSARNGYNIAQKSSEMPWYLGPTILNALESFQIPASTDEKPLRLVLQDVYRFDERRILSGRIESGSLKVGDELVFWPEQKKSKIRSIETWPQVNSQSKALSGESIGITLEEQIFVERGQIASHPDFGLVESRDFQANLFWLHDQSLELDKPYQVKIGTQVVEGRIIDIQRIMDSSTLAVAETARVDIRKNEVAEVRIRTRRPIAFDNSDVNQSTGRFVIMQGERIGGGGIIQGGKYPHETKGTASDNITWSSGKVSREAREALHGHRGAIIWLTGLSGSGKSTLAVALETALFRRGISSVIVDGDNLRHGLCSDLGFSDKDRIENIRRAGELSKLLAELGQVVITSLISPFQEERNKVRILATSAGIPFAEIYVNAPIEECEKRDPKSLYKKARSGEIKGFTGIDSPYEAPTRAELEIKTHEESEEESLGKLLDYAIKLTSLDEEVYGEEEPEAQI